MSDRDSRSQDSRSQLLRRACAVACLAVALAPAGCSDSPQGHEAADECLDGKDNDGDSWIDCADSDCASLGVCGARRPDSGGSTVDGLGPPPDSGGPAVDQGPPPDSQVDSGGSTSSAFGQRCEFTGKVTACADGETLCVPSPDDSQGYCTRRCSGGQPESCPPAPSGQRALCLYAFNQEPFCLFVCDLFGKRYPCPTGFACVAFAQDQRYCRP